MTVQVWADGFGNWHALVTDEAGRSSQGKAYAAIFRELEDRAHGSYEIDTERFSVEMVAENGGLSEWVEKWEGDQTPFPNTATCGTCGKSFPDIYPSARCPYESEHEDQDVTEDMSKAERFFYTHAGFSWNPKTQTEDEGKRECARLLAAAERWASEEGIAYRWAIDEWANSSDFSDDTEPHALWQVVAYHDGDVVGSLGGVDFGDGGDPWQSESSAYRRVTEAEIALERVKESGMEL
jgi:hypothetical protein